MRNRTIYCYLFVSDDLRGFFKKKFVLYFNVFYLNKFILYSYIIYFIMFFFLSEIIIIIVNPIIIKIIVRTVTKNQKHYSKR